MGCPGQLRALKRVPLGAFRGSVDSAPTVSWRRRRRRAGQRAISPSACPPPRPRPGRRSHDSPAAPIPVPRPEVGGYGRRRPSGLARGVVAWRRIARPPLPPHRRDWRAVARTAQRPGPMLGFWLHTGLPPCWRYGQKGLVLSGTRALRWTSPYPSLSIRQYLVGPTVRVLWGGQDQVGHGQMCLHTTKPRIGWRLAG